MEDASKHARTSGVSGMWGAFIRSGVMTSRRSFTANPTAPNPRWNVRSRPNASPRLGSLENPRTTRSSTPGGAP